jgi:acetolactate synthase-1/2/3 large subunit
MVGDGTLLYNPVVQSLGYAANAQLPIIIVVFNNNEYTAMRENHLDYYPDGVSKQHSIYYGAPVNGPDYAVLGAPFGGWGRKVEDPAQLVPALRDAHAATREGRTAILNVVLNR